MDLLIVCHPRKVILVNNVISNHWYSDIVNSIVDQLQLEIRSVETVDIIEGGDMQADCFSIAFYNSNKYDFIISPDAGGDWFNCQKRGDFKLVFYKKLI